MTLRPLAHGLAFSLSLCANQSAIAVSPLRADVKLSVSFPSGSSVVPKASVAEIGEQVSCFKSISLEVVHITTTGDNAPSKLDGAGQMKLAAERANVLRASFLDLGVEDRRIYTEAHAVVQTLYPGQSPKPDGGEAQIEYFGVCQGGPGFDCRVQCKGQPDTEIIIRDRPRIPTPVAVDPKK